MSGRWKKQSKRIATLLLAVLLIGNTVSWSAATVKADEETSGGETVSLTQADTSMPMPENGSETQQETGATVDTPSAIVATVDTPSAIAATTDTPSAIAATVETPAAAVITESSVTVESPSAVVITDSAVTVETSGAIELPDVDTVTADNAQDVLDMLQNVTVGDLTDEEKAKYEALTNLMEERTLDSDGYDAQGILKYSDRVDGNSGVMVTGSSATGINVVIPDFIIRDGTVYEVTAIGDRAFYYKTSLNQVEIPDTVTRIGSFAFQNCSSLQKVTVLGSEVEVGYYAFASCYNLNSVSFSGSVKNIVGYAFYNCYNLTNLKMTKCVSGSAIGSWAFAYCSGLTGITIPDGVTEIGDYAFYICKGLKNVTLPGTVESIGEAAFSGCSALKRITFPDSVTSVGQRAFSSCTSLESIEIQGNAITFSPGSGWTRVFNYCGELKNISILCDCDSDVLKKKLADNTGITRNGDGTFTNSEGKTGEFVTNHHWVEWTSNEAEQEDGDPIILTAKCSKETYSDVKRVIKINAPDNPITYDGETHPLDIEDNYAAADPVTVIYTRNGETCPTGYSPKLAGSYGASVTMTGEDNKTATVHVDPYRINKAELTLRLPDTEGVDIVSKLKNGTEIYSRGNDITDKVTGEISVEKIPSECDESRKIVTYLVTFTPAEENTYETVSASTGKIYYDHLWTWREPTGTTTSASITASCMDCGAERTITLTAPEATYNCDPHAVTVTDDCDIVTSSSAIYTTQDGQTIAGAPTNAGTYTASIAPIYGDDGAEQAISVTYVIDKAAPELIFPPITEGNPGFSGLKSRTTAWFNGQPISGYVKSVKSGKWDEKNKTMTYFVTFAPSLYPYSALNMNMKEVTVETSPYPCEHLWIWRQTADNHITASCKEKAECLAEDREIILTLNASAETLSYTGTEYSDLVTVSDNYGEMTADSVTYEKDGEPIEGFPKDAGNYTASITMTNDNDNGTSGETASVTFTINKAAVPQIIVNGTYENTDELINDVLYATDKKVTAVISGTSIDISDLGGWSCDEKPSTDSGNKYKIYFKISEKYRSNFEGFEATATITIWNKESNSSGAVGDVGSDSSYGTPGNENPVPGEDNPNEPGDDNPDNPDEPDEPDDPNEPGEDNPDNSDRIDIPDKNINRVDSDKDGQDNGKAKNKTDKKNDKENTSGRKRTPVVTEEIAAPIEKVQEIVNDVVAKVFNYETGGVIFGAVQVGAAVASGMISIKWIRAFVIVIIDAAVFLITFLVILRRKIKEDKKE